MRSQTTIHLLFSLAALALAKPAMFPREDAAAADCGETAAKVCFGVQGGTSQNINLDDLQFVADTLRLTGSDHPGALWTMPVKKAQCEEWMIEVQGAGSVLAWPGTSTRASTRPS